MLCIRTSVFIWYANISTVSVKLHMVYTHIPPESTNIDIVTAIKTERIPMSNCTQTIDHIDSIFYTVQRFV